MLAVKRCCDPGKVSVTAAGEDLSRICLTKPTESAIVPITRGDDPAMFSRASRPAAIIDTQMAKVPRTYHEWTLADLARRRGG